MSNNLSRRKFLGGSAAALATASLAPLATSCQTAPAAPSFPGIYDFGSKFGGVQVGCTTYSYRNMPAGIENCIKYCRESGIDSIEFRSGPDLEAFLGAPQAPPRPAPQQLSVDPATLDAAALAALRAQYAGGRQPLTPEQQAAQDKYNADLKAWRMAVTPEQVAPAKKLFDDAGIDVHIVKFTPGRWSDEEIDYAFRAAKAMGARGVSEEWGMEAVRKMAPYAEKHGMYAIFHNHGQFGPEAGYDLDELFAVSPNVMLNFDFGHFYGTTGSDPCEIIRKYHDRIFSLHAKDKTGPNTDPPNTNQTFGQGETPIADVMLLLKKEGWPIYVDIELEYPIKPWSDQVKETKTCVQYLRNILI
jgi:sugar phosphate isomerase/epimerase